MTRHKDFKAVVRSRMDDTGESYTAARAALEAGAKARRDEAGRQQQLIINRWFDAGRLRSIPARRKVRSAVLLELLSKFVPGQDYAELEVSDILKSVHEDFAYLRRELVSFGYLDRRDGVYRVCCIAPTRTAQQRRELPVWEEIWLPVYAARTADLQTVREVS